MSLFRTAILIFFFTGLALCGNLKSSTTYHQGARSTPKLELMPATDLPRSLVGQGLVETFLTENANRYQLPADLSNLAEPRIKQSLLGTHYHYPQMLNGIPVAGAEIIVSVTYEEQIYQVFNNTWPAGKTALQSDLVLTVDEAFDVAWNHVGVHDDLIAAPTARLVYLANDGDFKLVYRVFLSVAAPRGDWQTTLDAVSGRILEVHDTRLPRKPMNQKLPKYDGPVDDRVAAFNSFQARSSNAASFDASLGSNGSGVVFDPDPRTTLNDSSIVDGSPDAVFTNAYFTRDLLDITEDNGTFSLTGPWVTISEHEAPVTQPSTTTDGNWTATRGDNSFNDAMTYFHLDQSQRYMQSLGFANDTGIQFLSIRADSDALGGADNSTYAPGANTLQFGHGCVDDNEDADVILHEYGHAINFSINDNWGGGDSGAMGEGFGDYWAGSYSIATPNGLTFRPEWVYTWDGHGDNNLCWNGRLLNVTDAMYDPDLTYGAHQNMGGFVSDELWASPLFAALLGVMEAGGSRDDADQIILQAQFGLGSGLRMPDLAAATVNAAALLFPSGPHAGVFQEKFEDQNILSRLAFVSVDVDESIISCDQDGILDNGETGLVTIRLKNTSPQILSNITATITSNNDVTMSNGGVINFAASDPDQEFEGSVEITLNEGTMGTLELDITYQGIDPEIAPREESGSFAINQDLDFIHTSDDVEGGNRGWTLESVGGGISWSISSNQSQSGDHSWFIVDHNLSSGTILRSPPVQVPDAGDFTFSFFHRYAFESGWDGGVLELSTNGTDWEDIGPFTNTGYDGALGDNSNPIGGRQAFTGNSPDYPDFTEITVNLGNTYQGQTVQIRWFAGTDTNTGAEGWFVDDINFDTINPPVFPDVSEEDEVCGSCLSEILVTIRQSIDTEWPSDSDITSYVGMLNSCEE